MAITVDKMALLVPMDQGTMEGGCIYGDYEIVFNPTGLTTGYDGFGEYRVWISNSPYNTETGAYPEEIPLMGRDGSSIKYLNSGVPGTVYTVDFSGLYFKLTCVNSPAEIFAEGGTPLVYTINGIKPGTPGYDTTEVKDVYFIVEDAYAEQIIESRHIACIGGYLPQ